MPGDSTSSGGNSRRDVSVVFDIEPSSDSCCPLEAYGERIKTVRHHLDGDECHTDTMLVAEGCGPSRNSESTEVVHATSDIDATCPCTVFGEFDCVPELVDIVDGRMRIETYLTERNRLNDLVDRLEDVCDELRLRQLKRIDNGEADRSRNTVSLDLYDITEKQREAVTTAVAEGYYATPRETSLGELADEFGVTTSALSQRLKAVESKLAIGAFAESGMDG